MLILRFDKNLENQIKTTVSQLDISQSELIRIRVYEYIQIQQRLYAWEIGKELFGAYSSRKANLSINNKSLIKEKIRTKHQ